MTENIGLKGEIFAKIIKPNGKIIEYNYPNLVVADGKTNIAGMLIADNAPGDAYDYIAIGTGSTTPDVTDTDLVNEVYARINTSGAQLGSVASFTGSFAISGTVAITEYGLFNAATAGSMLSRISGATVTLGDGDFLEINHRITVG